MRIQKLNRQSKLDRFPQSSGQPERGSGDVTEFLIRILDSETGNEVDRISLRGNNRPFQPVTTPVSQEIYKFYYPGSRKRQPTVQVLGSMHEDVQLSGVFDSYQESNRDAPLNLSALMTQLCEDGQLCHFQIGDWSRYGFVASWIPSYRQNSLIEWRIHLIITGDTNPLQKFNETAQQRLTQDVFSPQNIDDIQAVREEALNIVEQAKRDLEATKYVPTVVQPTFSLSAWVKRLSELPSVAPVVELGNEVVDVVRGIADSVTSALDTVEGFVEEGEDLSRKAQGVILFLESQRAKIAELHSRAYNAYSKVSASVGTATRIGSWEPVGLLGGMSVSLNRILYETEERLYGYTSSAIQAYVVRSGDTLQSIAVKEYGDWREWESIKRRNNLKRDIQENDILIL